LALMRQAARDCAGLRVTEIARTICEWLDWKRPNGQLKNHECRLLLERLGRDGFLTLPALRPCESAKATAYSSRKAWLGSIREARRAGR
jgi:hypothetical protein